MKGRGYFARSLRLFGLTAWMGLFLWCWPGFSSAASWEQTGAITGPTANKLGHQGLELRQNQPLYFVENQGQAAKPVKYYHQGPGPSLWFTAQEIGLAAQPGAAIRLQPVGMSPGTALTGAQPQAGKVNFFNGSDPAKWRRGIATFGEVVYREAYPGTDLRFYGNGQHLEYDVVLRPGADPARVRFRCRGVEALTVRTDGSLALRLPGGKELVQARPRIYQEIEGKRVDREGVFEVAQRRGVWTYGFGVGHYDRDYPLVIDPVLEYSSYLGGDDDEEVRGIAVDPAGNVYLTGRTASTNFPPHTSGLNGSDDCFVTKIDAKGALVYSTYLGGSENDPDYDNEAGSAIAADANGNAYVAGYTWSIDFPTVGAFQNQKNGGYDAFVARLNSAGVLVFSSYLGGAGSDFAGRVFTSDDPSRGGNAVAVDGSGNMYVVGYTDSDTLFPVTAGAYQTTRKGSDDAFVAKISPAGALLYCTYLGGSVIDANSYNEGANAVAADAAGNAYVTGFTFSTDFPFSANAYQKTNLGGYDGFVAKFNSTGGLIYASYLGGSRQ